MDGDEQREFKAELAASGQAIDSTWRALIEEHGSLDAAFRVLVGPELVDLLDALVAGRLTEDDVVALIGPAAERWWHRRVASEET